MFDQLNKLGLLNTQDDKWLFGENIAYCFDAICDYISKKLEKLGYIKVIGSDETLNNLVTNNHFNRLFSINNQNLELYSYAKLKLEIEEARTDLIDILQIYESCFLDLFNITLLSGKNVLSNEIEYVLSFPYEIDKGKIVANLKTNKIDDYYLISTSLNMNFVLSSFLFNKDEKGIILPVKIAKNQIVILPIKQNMSGVLKKCNELYEELNKNGIRTKLDKTNEDFNSLKDKYQNAGIPFVVAIGPKDLELNQVEVYSRISEEKECINFNELIGNIPYLFDQYSSKLKNINLKKLLGNVKKSQVLDDSINQKIVCCNDNNCIKEITKDSRRISIFPFNQTKFDNKCIICKNKAQKVLLCVNK